MATKKFTVIDTRSNSTKVFESTANTLGELKRELNAQGITTDNMAIQEALTRVQLINDDSVLPHDVAWHGTVTNNLVFRITQDHKNILSGMSRAEVYKAIKTNNLAALIKETFGRNFTQVATDALTEFICGHEQVTNTPKQEPEVCENLTKESVYNGFNVVRMQFASLVTCLLKKGVLNDEEMDALLKPFGLVRCPSTDSTDSPYSEEELDEILESL